MNSAASSASQGRYRRFADFYPFCLSQHSHPTCRRLHFVGTYPWYSLAADFVLFRDMLLGRIRF